LKEFLREMIVNWAASVGQIDALEWAWDWGMHGYTETCMWAATYGHLHVLQWLQDYGAIWDSHVSYFLCWGRWVWLCCGMD
jgi:hypothetical protein